MLIPQVKRIAFDSLRVLALISEGLVSYRWSPRVHPRPRMVSSGSSALPNIKHSLLNPIDDQTDQGNTLPKAQLVWYGRTSLYYCPHAYHSFQILGRGEVKPSAPCPYPASIANVRGCKYIPSMHVGDNAVVGLTLM